MREKRSAPLASGGGFTIARPPTNLESLLGKPVHGFPGSED